MVIKGVSKAGVEHFFQSQGISIQVSTTQREERRRESRMEPLPAGGAPCSTYVLCFFNCIRFIYPWLIDFEPKTTPLQIIVSLISLTCLKLFLQQIIVCYECFLFMPLLGFQSLLSTLLDLPTLITTNICLLCHP